MRIPVLHRQSRNHSRSKCIIVESSYKLSVKVINTTLIFKSVSALAKLQQHGNSRKDMHSTHEVRSTTYAHALDYMLISRDISLYENNETDV